MHRYNLRRNNRDYNLESASESDESQDSLEIEDPRRLIQIIAVGDLQINQHQEQYNPPHNLEELMHQFEEADDNQNNPRLEEQGNMAEEQNFQEAIIQQLRQQQLENQQIIRAFMQAARPPRRPVTELKPPTFSGKEKECIIDWITKFERTATHNEWDDDKQLTTLPLYLADGALVYYNNLDGQY